MILKLEHKGRHPLLQLSLSGVSKLANINWLIEMDHPWVQFGQANYSGSHTLGTTEAMDHSTNCLPYTHTLERWKRFHFPAKSIINFM